MKPYLGKPRPLGWKKPGAPKGNKRAAGRKCRGAFSFKHERHDVGGAPADGEYLFANCVVLAAAIFAQPWAQRWAEELLPAARKLDARRLA